MTLTIAHLAPCVLTVFVFQSSIATDLVDVLMDLSVLTAFVSHLVHQAMVTLKMIVQ